MASIAGGTDILACISGVSQNYFCDKPHTAPGRLCQVDTPIKLKLLRNRYNSPDPCDIPHMCSTSQCPFCSICTPENVRPLC